MNIFQKMVQKYGSPPVGTMLPPPPEAEEELNIPVESSEVDPKWAPLIEESEGLDPLTQKPAQSPEELLGELSDSEPPSYEKELLKVLRPEFHSSDKDAPTRPPPKRASYNADHIMRLCKQYHDLCCKL